ncbi:A disintegrin and metalloproteinase with thrombospondin motifs 7 [Dipodomys merriami]|uniref:A disintegrin and metalloproteinase with thrombospondin motifs 7 n=1 Tax=Dipodomys merriami TaxID=94247 RepID=UPI003855D8AD
MHGRPGPRSPARLRLLLLLLCALTPGAPGLAPGAGPGAVVYPARVDADGAFLSFELRPRALRRRAAGPGAAEAGQAGPGRAAPAFYALRFRGRRLRFRLAPNPHLLAPGFVSETRGGGGLRGARIHARAPACHLLGAVRGPALGRAAISACHGLKGVFQLSNEDYFIEPLEGAPARPGHAQPHLIYKRQTPEHQGSGAPGTCGVQGPTGSSDPETQRELWEQRQRRQQSRRMQPRSVSREKWVETLVVADSKMVEYHGQPQVESYVLTIMNMVASLFHHPSIGNPIHITIVRLVLLEDEEDLKITHHADNTLGSFCRWQKSINMKGDSHPQHHDTAILLTRKDLCVAMNRPCETLGLSHVAGMCQPLRSCSVSEDTGLPLAFTVAHELGHSFGIQHDGSGNDCEPRGKRPSIMSPQLLYDSAPLAWSRCSRQYITRFLDRGWGACLDDPPAKDVIRFPSVPPGVLYDVSHQCRLQYGGFSSFCSDMDNVCHTLWCSVGTTCHSKLDAAVDGTQCGEDKWCLNGECVPVGFEPKAVDGGWSGWSAWSACSRSCGVGVQSAERQCTQPVPKYEGKYCVGERKRSRLCSLQACPPGYPSFRQVQCSQFDSRVYKGQLHAWVPVVNDEHPCELHCRPAKEYFAEKLRDAVVDGTPCYPGRASRDLCINGICKNVGCDFEIDSGAVEDRCGVCRGNGSTCHTVSKMFEDAEGLGYVDVGRIPAGAREILIQEVAEAANFLALRSEDPDKYFLNGGWTIQWNGVYHVAGTAFTYARSGHQENLTAPGPTSEPIWIQLLFQESNPGVHYEYTIHREADGASDVQPPNFSWHYGPWSPCTVTCGTGTQRQSVHCVEQQAGLVDEDHCDPTERPDDLQRTCSGDPCPPRWWAGEWQPCSRSCGPRGVSRRAVLCLRSIGLDEQSALPPTACQPLPPPPAETPCNRHLTCPATWAVGNWSQCSVTCGTGIRHREVLCTNDTSSPCDPADRPAQEAICPGPPCPRPPDRPDPEGSASGFPSSELFNEVDFIPGHGAPRPGPTAAIGNAIGEAGLAPDPGLPAPMFVDDFYYDYNFINFHEDLSYGPSDEPPAGAAQTHQPTTRPAQEPSRTEESEPQGPSHSPSPPLEQASRNVPLTNFLSEDEAPMGTPDLELPRVPWPPALVNDANTPAAPPSLDEPLVREDGQTLPRPLPWSPEDPEGTPDPRVLPLPRHPLPTQTSSTHSSPSPDRMELGTGAGDPWLEEDLASPSDAWPTRGVASPLPTGSETGDMAHPTEPEAPLLPVPGLAEPSNFLPTVLSGPEHLSWTTALNPGPPGPPTPPGFDELLNPGLLATVTPDNVFYSSNAPEPQPGRDRNSSPGSAIWLVGNWSQCSTTCGLGASWRLVGCSSGRDEDCPLTARPQPARRCHLRPCAAWHAGNWSKCSRSCGGGSSVRDVQCVDTRDLRPLRPFHCQLGPPKPAAGQACGTQPCLSWYISSWRECSEACGGGEQQRLVTCPEPGLCEEAARPNSTQPCNTHPCTQWVVGPWGQCSAPCGGGAQRRLVRCVNTRTGLREEDGELCSHEPWPESSRPCGTEDCDAGELPRCDHDRLSFGFCETLRLLGRCALPSIRAQCCRTCPVPSYGARGRQRATRR